MTGRMAIGSCNLEAEFMKMAFWPQPRSKESKRSKRSKDKQCIQSVQERDV